ncbi:MAG TPA: UDP-glucose/GDP-mannose dehydrogenase family protein [Planctomycetaceae bacterium]|nr:UDP-glucose/GDP-mannose dehydrogenase family protein [Planctomycetaceae bacterium]
MRIVMIGTGYVGLVTGTCLADSGNDVTCVDINQAKIDGLKRGVIPIYEPGLEELVKRNVHAKRLQFTTDLATAVKTTQLVFIAVGTPQGDDGHADLSALWAVVDTLAPHLPVAAIVVVKSTVPVGTNRMVYERLREKTGRDVSICSNPEFLKEGCAIDDFTKPDRVVVGMLKPEVGHTMHELYKPFLRTERPFLTMGLESAEMTKYVANCMLATKISFINEMANLCEAVGADINEVRRGIGHDQRIGFQFLFPGVGYGGSCFPKDVRALVATSESHGLVPRILLAVDEINDRQKHVLFKKVTAHFGESLTALKIAVWGLSFKPKTDDIREAPALVLIEELLASGAKVAVHDPVAMENVRAIFGERLTYCEHHYDAIESADALVICTEWPEFRNPDFDYLRHKLKHPLIFDGRNLWEAEAMRDRGFVYHGIGLSSEPV